jgi:U2-associated protein SR140
MWPRTAEERARGRNTGFVCFMERQDAADAMDAFQDTDCFHNGRRILLRWGKNVKKTVKRGTGGVPIAPIRGTRVSSTTNHTLEASSEAQKRHKTEEYTTATAKPTLLPISSSVSPSISTIKTSIGSEYDQQQSQKMPQTASTTSVTIQQNHPYLSSSMNQAVRVVLPKDPNRAHFISIVASYVARDGAILERRLMEKEEHTPEFAFLRPLDIHRSSREALEESIFYRWRVYAYAQNDGINSWNTKPFQMFAPDGQWWIPPPLIDARAAEEELLLKRQKEEELKALQEQRRVLIKNKKDYLTGRQLEHAKLSKLMYKGGIDVVGANALSIKSKQGEDELTEEAVEQFESLFLKNLTCSRRAICDAMAFCFDHNNCAVQICQLLKNSVMASFGPNVSIDTRLARLYLISDVLFNSQQPGVRNAFRYRDAIEEMAPQFFKSLGKEIMALSCGRMTFHKLHSAVTAVLDAWSSWSVYHEKFMEDLKLVFESSITTGNALDEVRASEENRTTIIGVKDLNNTPTPFKNEKVDESFVSKLSSYDTAVDGEPLEDGDLGEINSDAIVYSDDVDGEPLEEGDVDGEPLEDDDVIMR